MVNLRSKTKVRGVAPRTASNTEATVPLPNAKSDLSEAALRKLPRSELQKLAKAHKVKANMKSELIIRQLSSLQIPKTTKRHAEDDFGQGPSKKRFKGGASAENVSISPESPTAPTSVAQPQADEDTSIHVSQEVPQVPSLGQSVPGLIPSEPTLPTGASYDEDLFSGTESAMTEEDQFDFSTPVSSRAETPPPANLIDLQHCVKIMQEVSAQDVILLDQVPAIREAALRLRRKARDLRDLVAAEHGRRVRMESYLRYWQETCPNWDREWLYGEKAQPNNKDSDRSTEPPDVPEGPLPQQRAAAAAERKPALSPEELKQLRQAIIAKQEAEQRQLEALQRREVPMILEWKMRRPGCLY